MPQSEAPAAEPASHNRFYPSPYYPVFGSRMVMIGHAGRRHGARSGLFASRSPIARVLSRRVAGSEVSGSRGSRGPEAWRVSPGRCCGPACCPASAISGRRSLWPPTPRPGRASRGEGWLAEGLLVTRAVQGAQSGRSGIGTAPGSRGLRHTSHVNLMPCIGRAYAIASMPHRCGQGRVDATSMRLGRPRSRASAGDTSVSCGYPHIPNGCYTGVSDTSNNAQPLPLSTLGGGGNRTRVLQYLTRASPGAASCAFLSPGDHASKSPTGSAAVCCPAWPRGRVRRWIPLADARHRVGGVPGLTDF
jgi:hypothetical protein